MRCSRPGSTSSSGRWTCGPPGSLAPWRSSASALTWICCKNADIRLAAPVPGPGWGVGPGGPAGHRSGRKRRRPGWTARGPGGPRSRTRPRGRPGRTAAAARRRGWRAEPGRAGHHHRAVVRGDRRPPPRPKSAGYGWSTPPTPGTWSPRPPVSPHPVVRYRAAPRRHRRRPRLRTRPAPPARHHKPHGYSTGRPWTGSAARNPAAGLDQPAADHHGPDHPRQLRPPPHRGRLPAQPQTPAPGPRPQRPVHRTRLRRPAARCDLDHTIAWDQGGQTCECDLAPLCRHHHKCKQAHGWQLEQPEPGVLIWHTPAGRTYITRPTQYPA